MKTKLYSLLFWASALLMCACTKNSDLLHCASSADMVIASINLSEICENAGCKTSDNGIVLSDALQRLDRKMGGEISSLVGVPGVDLHDVVLSMPDASTVAFAFKVTNESAFAKYLVENASLSYTDESGIAEYVGPNFHIFIEDGIATLVSGRSADYSTFRQLQNDAKEAPVSEMQRAHLSDGNAANVLFSIEKFYSLLPPEYINNFVLGKYSPEQIKDGCAALAVSLSGTKLSASLAFYDKDNRLIESPDSPGTIDTSLLKYASATDIAAAIVAVPKDFDWSATFDKITRTSPYAGGLDPEIVAVISEILSNVDGSAMLAGGPKTVMGIQELSGWSAVAAVQFKKGKAQEYFDQIKNMAAESLAGIATVSGATATKLTLTIPNAGTFYVETLDNMLLISLSPIEKSDKCQISASQIKGCNGAFVLSMPKNNVFSLLVKFPFGIDAAYVAKDNAIDLTIEETETDGLFLDNLIRFASSL